MKTLKKLLDYFNKSCSALPDSDYAIPRLWNLSNYKNYIEVDSSIIKVDRNRLFSHTINYILKNSIHKNSGLTQSLAKSLKENNNGNWIKKSIIYSMQIRTSTCFDHDLNGQIIDNKKYTEHGTFLKTILLIPYLKHIGINCLYLLPIMKYSRMYKKGNLGSPYSIKNFYQLEETLYDQLTGEHFTVEDHFKALVEACHLFDIRIILDFIPRTNARNSDLIITNPEYFYWIKKEDLDKYKTPYIPNIANLVVPEPKHAAKIYNAKSSKDFIQLFQDDIKTTNPKIWQKILNIYKETGNDILEIIESETGLTTAPAFADVINDNQPNWQDVTYLRLYLDHPKNARKYIKKNQPPYLLFDVAKASLNPGLIPNQKLWDLIAEITPTYQKKYGIDGMRIDMGHALPTELTKKIIQKARDFDNSFAFIAEELNNHGSNNAKKLHYNSIIGDGFYKLPRHREFLMHEFIYDAPKFSLPLLAMVESHDTPRAITRIGYHNFARQILIMNMFIPNTIPFINSGQELLEKQPMNIGLDSTLNDLYQLNDNHPLHTKLALFDTFYFNYHDREFISILHILSTIRNNILSDDYLPLHFLHMRIPSVGFAYIHKNISYLIVAHTNFDDSENITVRLENIRTKTKNNLDYAQLIFSTHEINHTIYSFNFDGSIKLWMAPGEVKIIKF